MFSQLQLGFAIMRLSRPVLAGCLLIAPFEALDRASAQEFQPTMGTIVSEAPYPFVRFIAQGFGVPDRIDRPRTHLLLALEPWPHKGPPTGPNWIGRTELSETWVNLKHSGYAFGCLSVDHRRKPGQLPPRKPFIGPTLLSCPAAG